MELQVMDNDLRKNVEQMTTPHLQKTISSIGREVMIAISKWDKDAEAKWQKQLKILFQVQDQREGRSTTGHEGDE